MGPSTCQRILGSRLFLPLHTRSCKKNDLSEVYKRIDARTSQDIAPTKIPAGAIEFGIQKLGEIESVELDVHKAICTIKWKMVLTDSSLREQLIRWGILDLLIFPTLYLFFPTSTI